jgi:hypothetical protein
MVVGFGAAVACGGFAVHADAATYAARVRFWPSADVGVAGYRLSVCPVGAPCLAPIDLGVPPLDADGTLGGVASGLDVCTGYDFFVTAYGSDGSESSASEPLRLRYADVAPLLDPTGSCTGGPGPGSTTTTTVARATTTTATTTVTTTTVPGGTTGSGCPSGVDLRHPRHKHLVPRRCRVTWHPRSVRRRSRVAA